MRGGCDSGWVRWKGVWTTEKEEPKLRLLERASSSEPAGMDRKNEGAEEIEIAGVARNVEEDLPLVVGHRGGRSAAASRGCHPE